MNLVVIIGIISFLSVILIWYLGAEVTSSCDIVNKYEAKEFRGSDSSFLGLLGNLGENLKRIRLGALIKPCTLQTRLSLH